MYTHSFLPAAIQVAQHLIDKIDEAVENPPDLVTPTSTTIDTPLTAVTIPSISPTTTNVPSTITNISPTTTNTPPASSNVSIITTNVSPKITDTLPVMKASVLTTHTTEMPSLFVHLQIDQTSQLHNNESPQETMTNSESYLISVTPEQTNSQNMDNCPSSISLISDDAIYISNASRYQEYTVLNGTVNEGFIESVLKKVINFTITTLKDEGMKKLLCYRGKWQFEGGGHSIKEAHV